MNVIPTTIGGTYLLELDFFSDQRGSLTKIFTETSLVENGLPTHFPEHFFSVSKQGVLRGMHAQKGHTECGKFIYVSNGRVLDVVLDIRPDSPTFKQFFSTELSADNHRAIYVPKGCLHGFLALEDNTHTVYFQTEMRDPSLECGVRYDSFDMDWGMATPIVSDRDNNLPTMEEFIATLRPAI